MYGAADRATVDSRGGSVPNAPSQATLEARVCLTLRVRHVHVHTHRVMRGHFYVGLETYVPIVRSWHELFLRFLVRLWPPWLHSRASLLEAVSPPQEALSPPKEALFPPKEALSPSMPTRRWRLRSCLLRSASSARANPTTRLGKTVSAGPIAASLT